MILLALSTPSIHACGVDDGPRYLAPVPRPVLSVGRFGQALLGHSCQAPKQQQRTSAYSTDNSAPKCANLPGEQIRNEPSPQGGGFEKMARRRYQKPTPKKRGEQWTILVREDLVQNDDCIRK